MEDFNEEMMADEIDEEEQRDLSYWHITVPRIESIFERNKKVCCMSLLFSFEIKHAQVLLKN